MKRFSSWLLAAALAVSFLAVPAAAADYRDVPAEGALAGEVRKAVDYGLMQGYSETTFGYGDSMTRAQFVTVLRRMMGWSGSEAGITQTMALPEGLSATYRAAIGAAVQNDVVDSGKAFRPNAPITRGEMAEMLVRALGLKSAAEHLHSSANPNSDAYSILHGTTPFTDLPEGEEGYITVAYTIGMTKGTSETTFSPDQTATRAQAAAMLVRIYEKLHQKMDFLHGFYAISSYSQLDFARNMDAVSAGWSRMTWNGETALLSTTSAGGNEFAIPSGYDSVTGYVDANGIALNLNVFMDASGGAAELLASENGRSQAVEQIIHELTVSYNAIGKNPYNGVTIDFEGLRKGSKSDFTAFLTELRAALDQLGQSLYVCVSPVLSSGYYSGGWYDGYDYAAIGALADKVILMAYDYEPRDMSSFIGTTYHQTAASAPIDQVYLGLKALTNEVAPEKVALGFSCKNVAWKIDADGKLLSGTPVYPSNDTVSKRLAQESTEFGWSQEYQQSYAIYRAEDGGRYFLWYQNERSIQAALDAARLLGVTGVSVWRLGTVPMYSGWNWMRLLDR